MPYNLIVIAVCLRRLLESPKPIKETVVLPKWFERLIT
jgi:hypothetical protein